MHPMAPLTKTLLKSYILNHETELKQYQKKLSIAKKRFCFYQNNPLSHDASSYDLAVYDAAEKQYSLYAAKVLQLEEAIQILKTQVEQNNDKTTS
jgi:glycine/serine hydroxymethyltransferase